MRAPADFDTMVEVQHAALERRSGPATTPFGNPNPEVVRRIVLSAQGETGVSPADAIEEREPFFGSVSLYQTRQLRAALAEARSQFSYYGIDEASELSTLMYCSKCDTSKQTTEFTTSIFKCDRHFR